jgi:SAM-dependent methyltransferase
VAAEERGWQVVGIEPSQWASDRARGRGLDVRTTDLARHELEAGTFDLVAMCDVIEHLTDPAAALGVARDLLREGGGLYLTLPDAGSGFARLMGRRWWSVLPMHVQYFTRDSARRLLGDAGFDVRLVASHAKVFSARYYAERLGGYAAAIERVAVGAVERVGLADRLIAPDFHDRMAVVAVRR